MPIDRQRRRARRHRTSSLTLAALAAVLVLAAAACSGDDAAGSGSGSDVAAESTTTSSVPALASGPAAELSEELTAGAGPFIGAASATDLAAAGYVEQELVAAGTATSYRSTDELATSGEWTFEPDAAADYRTRVLVRRPADPEDSSGVVVVEWLNVSGGIDANPEWSSLQEEIIRQGHTWVGVSAQLIGVEGGPVLVTAPGADAFAGKGLVGIDPERYGSLSHPGDGYSFDIYTQVARALREGQGLDGAAPELVLAAGESQSALALTTYYNGVQPLTGAFDGFFVHSRAAVPLPLVGPGEYADLAGSIGSERTLLRTDLDAPAMVLQAEGDVTGVLASAQARQDDSDTLRLWEVAGTAHADAHLLGPLAESAPCGVPINDGPLHLVAKAAFAHLVTWSSGGDAPPVQPRLELTDAVPPTVQRDGDGIARGGVRTPPVDVPAQVLSGDPGPSDDLFCLLLGTTTPLPPEVLAQRYAGADDYMAQYDAALQAAIDEGVLLEADAEAMQDVARADLVG
jgi:hypothetical protein